MTSTRPSRSLLRHGDFLKLWFGQSVSELGSQVTLLALPLVAVLTLHVGALQVGFLSAVELAPFILVGLPAGVWVDRIGGRRPVLVVADVGRVASIGSIPVVGALGHLGMTQLYVVAFVTGVLTVFFDVAYQSYLPALIDRDQLIDGNSKLEFTRSGAQISGPALGGALVGIVGAPIAMTADAASYVVSVLSLLGIRRREPRTGRLAARASMRSDIAAGLRFVLGNPLLRAIAACTATWNLFGNIVGAMSVLFCVRTLHMTATAIGLGIGIGSVGAPLGAALAGRISRRLGVGPTIVLSAALGAPYLILALAPASNPFPFLVASSFFVSAGVVYNITQVSLRQAICPPGFQGRMNATMRFIVWGTIPIGSLIGGVLGSTIGLRATMVLGGAGTALAVIPVAFSPVLRLRTIDEAIPDELRDAVRDPDAPPEQPQLETAPGVLGTAETLTAVPPRDNGQ